MKVTEWCPDRRYVLDDVVVFKDNYYRVKCGITSNENHIEDDYLTREFYVLLPPEVKQLHLAIWELQEYRKYHEERIEKLEVKRSIEII